MKPLLTCVLLSLSFVGIVSCEKDIDNSVPENAVKLEDVQLDFKNTLLKNTIKKNNKIWVSNELEAGLINSMALREEKVYEPTFFVAFEFDEDNTSKAYVTLGQNLQHQSESSPATSLFDNPNTYRVGGELRTELTFLSKGVLSNLKREGILGFDYRVTKFVDDEIIVKPYFTQAANSEIILRPQNFDTFKVFAEVCQYLYYNLDFSPGKDWLTPDPRDYFVDIVIREKGSDRVIKTFKSHISAFANLLTQKYDKDRARFLLRFVDLNEEQIEATADTEGRPSHAENYYSLGIKYLEPTSITSEEIVFDTYGEGPEEDKKYTVSCGKEVDNSVPENAEELEGVQLDFKNTLLKNTIKKNNKIWVSNELEAGLMNSLALREEKVYKPTFFVAFEFNEDNTSKTYVTIGQKLQDRSGISSATSLFDNPNIYRVGGGELGIELTFLIDGDGDGILHILEQESILGFDYRITKFSDDEIIMKPDFTQAVNSEIILRPYDFDTFEAFAEVCRHLYSNLEFNPDFDWLNPIPWDSLLDITIKEKSTGKVVKRFKSHISGFANLLTQKYDKDRARFLFRFVDLNEEQIEATADTEWYPSFAKNYYSLGIKYLEPTSINREGIVFDTYGEGPGEDKKYTVIVSVQ